MAQSYRIMLFNSDAGEARALRTLVQQVPGGRLIAEVTEAGRLASAVKESPVDVLLLNLDPDPDPVIAATGEVLSQHPDDLAVIAVGSSEESDLMLSLLHAGIREFLPKPLEVEHLHKAVGRLLGERGGAAPGGKVVSVLGAGGGVGVTTVATNLAVELAHLCGQRVALFDLDFLSGQVAILLDLLPTYTISDVLGDPASLELDLVRKAVCELEQGVDVLARPHHFEQAESLNPSDTLNVINLMQEVYPYVVLDGPPGFDSSSRQVIQMADHVLILMQLTVPSLRNVTRIFQEYDRHGVRLEMVDLIVNRMGIYKDLDVAQAEKTLNSKIAATIPDDWPTVRDAINLGEPLLKAAPKSKVRQAIEGLARRIHTGEQIQIEAETRKKGLFGLFGPS